MNPAHPSTWGAPREPDDFLDPPVATRNLAIGSSDIFLAADLDIPALLVACQAISLDLEIHDRDAMLIALPLAMPKRDLVLDPPVPKVVAAPPPEPENPKVCPC